VTVEGAKEVGQTGSKVCAVSAIYTNLYEPLHCLKAKKHKEAAARAARTLKVWCGKYKSNMLS